MSRVILISSFLLLVAASVALHSHTTTASVGDGATAALQPSSTRLPLQYFLEVEPREQKYLRRAMDYDGMLREGAVAAMSGKPSSQAIRALPTLESLSDGALVPYAAPKHSMSASEVAAAAQHRELLSTRRPSELRKLLKQKGADCDGCVEKTHLIERILEVRGWTTFEDRLALGLSALQSSAAMMMMPYHLGATLTTEQQAALALLQRQAVTMRHVLHCDSDPMSSTRSSNVAPLRIGNATTPSCQFYAPQNIE